MAEHAAADPFLEFVADLDTARAIEYVRGVAQQRGIERAVTDVLAVAEHEIGRRWASGEWTIGQEHAATAIVETALSVLGSGPPAPDAPRMALACAEGEWHTTPAKMAVVRLRDRGWRVDFLGGSQPIHSLAATLDRLQPPVVAISCTLARNLPGARRGIAAAHDRGIPVLLGGAALGEGDQRARAIGADAWGADLDAVDHAARAWLDRPPRLRTGTSHHPGEVGTLQRRGDDIVVRVYADLLAEVPDVATAPDHDIELLADDIRSFVDHLVVALDVDDPTVLQDLLADLAAPGTTRPWPRELVESGVAALARQLGDELPTARRFLAELELA